MPPYEPKADEFLFVGPVFLIAPWPRPSDSDETIRRLMRTGYTNDRGEVRDGVPLFSDLDLAERFLESLGVTAAWRPITVPTLDELAVVIESLRRAGETHIHLDLGGSRVRNIPIGRVLDGLLRRRYPPTDRPAAD